MGRLLCLICGFLLQGCCLFGASDSATSSTETERVLSGASGDAESPALTAEAARAIAVASDFVAAYRRGDRDTALELTDPGQRERGYEESMERTVRGIGDALGAETLGSWAIVGFRFNHEDHPELYMFIMHRVEKRWYVGCLFLQGLTEAFGTFRDYPDPPSDRLKSIPARRFRSELWRRESNIPAVRLDAPEDILIDDARKDHGTLLKFSVKGQVRVRITATTAEDASPMLAVQAPELGIRTSGSESTKSKHDRYSQGPREALIEHGLWDGTYLLRVRAGDATTVRLRIESLRPIPVEK